MSELVKLYDEHKKPLDGFYNRYDKFPDGYYNFCINIWIIVDKKIIIQKRSSKKEIYPNKYECVAGGVVLNEDIYQACVREVLEEININIDRNKIKLIHEKLEKQYRYFMYTFITKIDPKEIENIKLDPNEVSEWKIVNFFELEEMVINKLFSPSIENRFDSYKNIIKKYCDK